LTLCGQISGQLKSLQAVASLTAERDGETRKAALNTLATGYKILGMPHPLELSFQFFNVLGKQLCLLPCDIKHICCFCWIGMSFCTCV